MTRRCFFKHIFFEALFLSVVTLSCATNKAVPRDEFFYQENIFFFKEATLSNGIPVVIKNIPFEKNIELRLVFAGGASSCPNAKSGIDQLSFDLLAEGNPTIKDLLARGLYFNVSECKADYSSCGFSCGDKNFFESLDVFTASILTPEYSHEDYLKKESEAAAAALAKSESPRYQLLEEAAKKIYASSPYLDGYYYKPSSRVSEYDIERHMAGLLNASRISIVAAGNFSYKQKAQKGSKHERVSDERLFQERSALLLQKLEEAFGGLEAKEWKAPNVGSLSIKKDQKAAVHTEFAGGDFYSALCFSCPNRGDDDYEAFALSTIALDSVLSRELVERQRAAVYCGCSVLNSKQSAALIIASGKNEGKDFLESINEALAAFPQEYDLNKYLEMYKNIYIGRVLGASQNAAATCDQMASALYYNGDAKAFLNKPKKIRAVTAQAIIGAYQKYFRSEDSLFVLLTN